MSLDLASRAVFGFTELSKITGYSSFVLRTAHHENRLPARVIGQVGNMLVFDPRDASYLATIHPVRLTRGLYAQITAQQASYPPIADSPTSIYKEN